MAARRFSSLTLCLRNAAALSHLMRSISMPKPEATPGYTSACRIGLSSSRELNLGHETQVLSSKVHVEQVTCNLGPSRLCECRFAVTCLPKPAPMSTKWLLDARPHFTDKQSSTFCIPERVMEPYKPSTPSPPPSLPYKAAWLKALPGGAAAYAADNLYQVGLASYFKLLCTHLDGLHYVVQRFDSRRCIHRSWKVGSKLLVVFFTFSRSCYAAPAASVPQSGK